MCCEACVFGRGPHAEWCDSEEAMEATVEELRQLINGETQSATCWYCHSIIPDAPARHATQVQRIHCPKCGRAVWIPPAK